MSLHVETFGPGGSGGPAASGSELVFLHGWGMHGGVWRTVAESLARTRRVSLIDLPGHGRSPMLPLPGTLDHLADAVTAVLPERSTVIGWSLGGLLALTLALRHPARVERLALVGSTPCFVSGAGHGADWPHGLDAAVLDAFAARLRDDPRTTIRRFLALQVRGSVDERRTLARLKSALDAAPEPDGQALEAGLRILRETSLVHALPDIRQPVALIHGTRDTVAPYPAARASAALLPRASLHPIAGAGHTPFLSDPEAFVAIIEDLCDDE